MIEIKGKIIILVFILQCLGIINCNVIATYNLYGLSSATSISSTEDPSGQPTLEFPIATAEKPTFETEGLNFVEGQYLTFSGHFDNQGADYFTVNVWIKRNN